MNAELTVAELIAELSRQDPQATVRIAILDAAGDPYCDAALRRGAYRIDLKSTPAAKELRLSCRARYR